MNMQLLPQILELVNGNSGQEISKKVGLEPSQLITVTTIALPLILQAMSQNTSQNDGADALASALKKDHDGKILDSLGQYVEKTDFSEGEAILNHVVGEKKSAISETVGAIAGIDKQKAFQVIAILTPILMGLLGQYMQKQKISSQELATNLMDEKNDVAAKAPDAIAMFQKLIDTNGDGKIADDVVNIGSQLLGAFLKSR
jgi:hypothetical protein